MRTRSRLFRAGLMLACSSLTLATTLPAWAQPAPPPGQEDQQNGADPSTLAGSLSDLNGTVSYHAAGATEWSPATRNFPVVSGNAYWTEPQASATIEIGDDELVMDGGTELDVQTLDQHQFSASLPQGALFLGLRDLPDGQSLTVTTPRGAVQITQPGQYEIIAGDTNNPTSVSVVAGAAHVTATGVDLNVASQQSCAITGTDTFQGGTSALQQDQFLQTQLARFQPPQQQAPQAVARQVRYMTGGQQLAQYGSWQQTQQYGQLWYPSDVPSGWAPYTDGHWSYVAPWGWTWVDAEPWGFAPFHYGRWVNYDGRWGWMAAAPGVEYGDGYPVYAPALVGFVGVGGDVLAGAAIGFGAGLLAGGGGIGWFPLGYRDPFVPWYHVSDGYFRGINRYSGVDVRNITINNYRNITINNFSNARFARVAPERAFVRGDRMGGGFARPLPAADLGRVRPFEGGRLPVRPTAATPGLSRAVAARYNISVPARGAGPRGAGPAIRPGGFERGERPALRPNALPGNVRPANGALPAGARPNAGGRPGLGNRPGEAGRPGGAPGPEIGRPGGGAPGPAIGRPGAAGARPGGLPGLRPSTPGEAPPGINRPGENRPGENRPGGVNRPGEQRPGLAGPQAGRPGEAGGNRPGFGGARPGEAGQGVNRPGEARPGEARPGANRPSEAPGPRPGLTRPGEAGGPQAGRPGASRPEAARPEANRPAPARTEAARPEAARPVPRPEAARPAPRPEAARPAPRPESARPAPRPEAARPAPRPEAPRPAPRPQAPRPVPHPAPAARPAGGGHPEEHHK